ncbi:MAG: AEC family transporter [Caulobacteraceae bacterium]
MNFNTAVSQILILFIIMFIGIIAKRTRVINKNTESSISTLIMNIAMPALVLASTNFEKNSEVLPNMINILIITVVSYLVIILGSTLLAKALKYEKVKANVFISLIVFANVGFMGYPVIRALLAEIGVFYASIVNLVFNVLVWTYGILLFNRKDGLEFKKLLNIGTVSSLVAILIFLLGIRLPYPVQTALDLTGKMTAPLSMLLIGALIAEIDVKKLISDKKVYFVSIIRLIMVPVATAFILKAIATNSMVTSICTIMAAMPSAATNAIFANEFDSEPIFASVGVFISTLMSILTIPLTVYILANFIL